MLLKVATVWYFEWFWHGTVASVFWVIAESVFKHVATQLLGCSEYL